MKYLFIQISVCLLLAIVSLIIENVSGTSAMQDYLEVNGLTILIGLFAINITALVYVISRLIDLEKEHKKPYHFDESKREGRNGIYELFSMIVVVYFTTISAPLLLKIFPSDTTDLFSICVLKIPALILRASLFMAIYATLDFSKAIINCSLNPDPHSGPEK